MNSNSLVKIDYLWHVEEEGSAKLSFLIWSNIQKKKL